MNLVIKRHLYFFIEEGNNKRPEPKLATFSQLKLTLIIRVCIKVSISILLQIVSLREEK
jgi:hypothetical protein